MCIYTYTAINVSDTIINAPNDSQLDGYIVGLGVRAYICGANVLLCAVCFVGGASMHLSAFTCVCRAKGVFGPHERLYISFHGFLVIHALTAA